MLCGGQYGPIEQHDEFSETDIEQETSKYKTYMRTFNKFNTEQLNPDCSDIHLPNSEDKNLIGISHVTLSIEPFIDMGYKYVSNIQQSPAQQPLRTVNTQTISNRIT